MEDRPGVLRGGATLTLQTHQAQRLVKGREFSAEKPAIMGLFGFANLLRTIWHGARADEPYADWWMLKVHDALELSEQALIGAEQDIATRFLAMDAIDVSVPASIKPARIALNFSIPYAFRAARLVGRYDGLARALLSARHVGLLTCDAAERALHVGGRQVCRALQSPVGDGQGVAGQGCHGRVAGRRPHGRTQSTVCAGTARADDGGSCHSTANASPYPIAANTQYRLRIIPDLLRFGLCWRQCVRFE